jgi:uncharacterized membrane protein
MWLGIISALFLAYNAVAENFGFPIIFEGAAETIVNFVFAAIAAFSAMNNPTDANKF